METRRLDCSLFDLGGKEWKVPHDFVSGICRRCGEVELKVIKQAQVRTHGKSKSENRWNNA